jgi:hypothetical protein
MTIVVELDPSEPLGPRSTGVWPQSPGGDVVPLRPHPQESGGCGIEATRTLEPR